jgi:hypothetical protein
VERPAIEDRWFTYGTFAGAGHHHAPAFQVERSAMEDCWFQWRSCAWCYRCCSTGQAAAYSGYVLRKIALELRLHAALYFDFLKIDILKF